ncbi:hypothetical protein [Enterobacter roggenkampii]|uniref:hypothetical protein n=1 Tax=Enterobacter roggenkampii TaxID=1812935 RepID=UPI003218FB56
MALSNTVGDVSLCNEVLIGLGARPIASFNENTDEALACANLYATSRDDLLSRHDWPCAVKRVVLSPEQQPPAFGYSQSYTLPGDCIRVLGVSQTGQWGAWLDDYRLESGKLLCNVNPVGLHYIWRNDVVASWPAGLVSLFKLHLRWSLAFAITRDSQLEITAQQTFMQQLMLYKGQTSQEQPAIEFGGDSFISARY